MYQENLKKFKQIKWLNRIQIKQNKIKKNQVKILNSYSIIEIYLLWVMDNWLKKITDATRIDYSI